MGHRCDGASLPEGGTPPDAHAGTPADTRAKARQEGEAVHAFLRDLLVRWEDPEAILSMVAVGAPGAVQIADRAQAIAQVIAQAARADVVLLAGKGHENYQILADRTLEFDDREMARRALRDRGFDGPESGPGPDRY